MVYYFIISLVVIYVVYTLNINKKVKKQQDEQQDDEPDIVIKNRPKHKNNIVYLENYKKISNGKD